MTKEIADIIKAYDAAVQAGKQTALATVVHVEGSSYRRPGARMLVEENGRMTGAISGGCLEGDAYKKAMLAMAQKQNKLIAYNSMDEDDDLNFGVQLGCNGIVYILFEPIDDTALHNPVALLKACMKPRGNAVLVTLFSLEDVYALQPGTCLFVNEEQVFLNEKVKESGDAIIVNAGQLLEEKKSVVKKDEALNKTALYHFVEPPVSLIIAGAGNDALPMVKMATILGWHITLLDGRETHANSTRFPQADKLIVAKAEDAANILKTDGRTAAVLMTHNYHYDKALLKFLLQTECAYVGTLGPRSKLERMLQELEAEGTTVSAEKKKVIYGPTGLDIGAETAEEIALSVLAEIKAVMMSAGGGFLRNRSMPIHKRNAALL